MILFDFKNMVKKCQSVSRRGELGAQAQGFMVNPCAWWTLPSPFIYGDHA